MAIPLIGFYCATKWAFEALHESLAQEVKAFGIKVTLIEPGAYATEFGSPASLKSATGMEAYAELRQQVFGRLKERTRRSTGDPGRGPPTRRRAGAAAAASPGPHRPAVAHGAYAERLATWEAWEALSNAAQGEPQKSPAPPPAAEQKTPCKTNSVTRIRPTKEAVSRPRADRASANIPVSVPTPVVSVAPVVLPAPGRAVDLQMRVSAPTTGRDLPVILLSHGHGRSNHLSSLNGYGPLAHFWAAHGFVVIQPTHLSSKSLSLDPGTPGAPLFWRSRVEDMKRILDGLDAIEAAVPEIKGRVDRSRVAVAGHSMGGHTAGMLLGAQLTDEDGTKVNLIEPRIKAGVLLTPPGNGGADLGGFAVEIPFFRQPSFAEMTTPTLVVVGDQDVSPHLTMRGADWHADPYRLSTGPKCLLTLFGAGHGLGGISGYDVAETTDEKPRAGSRRPAAHLGLSPHRALPRRCRLGRPPVPPWTEALSALGSRRV